MCARSSLSNRTVGRLRVFSPKPWSSGASRGADRRQVTRLLATVNCFGFCFCQPVGLGLGVCRAGAMSPEGVAVPVLGRGLRLQTLVSHLDKY